MARTQAPPSSAVRQTQYAADLITSQRGLPQARDPTLSFGTPHAEAVLHQSSRPASHPWELAGD